MIEWLGDKRGIYLCIGVGFLPQKPRMAPQILDPLNISRLHIYECWEGLIHSFREALRQQARGDRAEPKAKHCQVASVQLIKATKTVIGRSGARNKKKCFKCMSNTVITIPIFFHLFLLACNNCTGRYIVIFTYVLTLYLSKIYLLHCSPSSLPPS
jgi:hypothetical protein